VERALVVTDSSIWTAETEYAAAVAAAEASTGVGVVVAAPAGSEILERLAGDAGSGSARAGEIVGTELPGALPGRSPADFLANVRALSELARRSRFDVAHSSHSTSHLMTALAVGRRAPLVHLRGSARPPRRGRANRFLYRRMTHAVIVPSARVRDWVVEGLEVSPDRVHQIFMPIGEEHFVPRPSGGSVRGALGIAAGIPIVVNVARLARVKGHEVLLTAWARVLAGGRQAALLLVGEPWEGELERLAALAGELGIEGSVVFAGRREDVPLILDEAALCVSSSVGSEENARAVGEYMAAGRAVVATRVGVVPELVDDGSSGSLVPPGDPEALAAGIETLLDDPATAGRMGDAGRRFAAERLTPGAFVAALERVIASVPARPGRQAGAGPRTGEPRERRKDGAR